MRKVIYIIKTFLNKNKKVEYINNMYEVLIYKLRYNEIDSIQISNALDMLLEYKLHEDYLNIYFLACFYNYRIHLDEKYKQKAIYILLKGNFDILYSHLYDYFDTENTKEKFNLFVLIVERAREINHTLFITETNHRLGIL